jgi:hypothetical protein
MPSYRSSVGQQNALSSSRGRIAGYGNPSYPHMAHAPPQLSYCFFTHSPHLSHTRTNTTCRLSKSCHSCWYKVEGFSVRHILCIYDASHRETLAHQHIYGLGTSKARAVADSLPRAFPCEIAIYLYTMNSLQGNFGSPACGRTYAETSTAAAA